MKANQIEVESGAGIIRLCAWCFPSVSFVERVILGAVGPLGAVWTVSHGCCAVHQVEVLCGLLNEESEAGVFRN